MDIRIHGLSGLCHRIEALGISIRRCAILDPGRERTRQELDGAQDGYGGAQGLVGLGHHLPARIKACDRLAYDFARTCHQALQGFIRSRLETRSSEAEFGRFGLGREAQETTGSDLCPTRGVYGTWHPREIIRCQEMDPQAEWSVGQARIGYHAIAFECLE